MRHNFQYYSTASVPPTTVVFQTPGATSWTAPAGVTSISVWGAGGGGGGGYDDSNYDYGGGGGGGSAHVTPTSLNVTPGNLYAIVIGSGGIASIGSGQGGPGGTTSIVYDSGTYTISGGVGGNDAYGPSGVPTAGGTGGGPDGGKGGNGTAGSGDNGSNASILTNLNLIPGYSGTGGYGGTGGASGGGAGGGGGGGGINNGGLGAQGGGTASTPGTMGGGGGGAGTNASSDWVPSAGGDGILILTY